MPLQFGLSNIQLSYFRSSNSVVLRNAIGTGGGMTHIQAWPPIVLGALCAAFAAATAGSASAAVLCVGAKQPAGCFSTITAAIAAANPGDTVQVAPGLYREQVVINKSLSLIGADTANTIIDAGAVTRPAAAMVSAFTSTAWII